MSSQADNVQKRAIRLSLLKRDSKILQIYVLNPSFMNWGYIHFKAICKPLHFEWGRGVKSLEIEDQYLHRCLFCELAFLCINSTQIVGGDSAGVSLLLLTTQQPVMVAFIGNIYQTHMNWYVSCSSNNIRKRYFSSM